MPEPSTVKRIGRYEIQAELGRGGFGRVYRAYDPTVGRLVAIKILTGEGADLLTRFRNEAAAAGNLHHRNIVTIYDFGDYDGLPYIAMEFLEGQDLNHVIAQQIPLSLLDKVSIMIQVADGLACAHRNGVVHRDVKPANIRLLPDGTIKIMDFGIARLTGIAAGPRLTHQGDLIGTLLYMSPEQIMGADSDALSDIFAYGVTYFELLTGRHPFQAADPRAVLFKITSQDAESVRTYAPDCPEALEQVVRRALQRDRELRYQNLKEVQFDTEPILIELRQERAATLLTEAQGKVAGEELDQAQALLLQVLDLDPPNRAARELRKALQEKIQKRILQPRIDALIAKGEASLEERRISEACEHFEGALRLDPDNTGLRGRRDEARALLERGRAAARLVLEARQLLKQDLAAALGKAIEAGNLDPHSSEAKRLVEAISKELEARERRRRLEQALADARQLLERGSFEEAEAGLVSLEPDQRAEPETAEMLEAIRTRRAEFERRERLRKEVAAAGESIRQSRFAEIVPRLRALSQEFPGERQVQDLLATAESGLREQERREAIAKLVEQARSLSSSRDSQGKSADFDGALALLAGALRTYPGEPALVQVHDEIAQAKAVSERAQAAARADAMRREARYDEALGLLAAAQQRYGADPALAGLAGQIRDEAVEAAIAGAGSLSEAGRIEDAIGALQFAMGRYPGCAALDRALARTEEALKVQRREIAKRDALARAGSLAGRGQYSQALEAIERARAQCGEDPELAAAAERIGRDWDAHKRAEAVRAAAAEAQSLVERGRPRDAIALLESAGTRYPGEPVLAESMAHACLKAGDLDRALRCVEEALASSPAETRLLALQQDVAAARAERERELGVKQSLAQAEALREGGQLERAIEVLTAARRQYGEAPVLTALASRIARELAVKAALAQAREAMEQGRHDQAAGILEPVAARYPGQEELARTLALARAGSAVRTLIDDRKLDQALAAARTALATWPSENGLLALEQEIAAAQTARKEALNRAESLRRNGQLEQALQALEAVRSQYGDDSALAALADRIASDRAARAARQEALNRAAALRQDGRLEPALQVLEAARAKYGDDPALAALADRITREREQIAAAQAARREALDRAEVLRRNGQHEQAVQALDTARTQYGDDPALAALAEKITRDREQIAAAQAARKEALNRADALWRGGQHEQAVQALEAARTRYGDDPALAALAEKITRDREQIAAAQAARKDALNRAEALWRGGQHEQAVQALEAPRAQYGDDPALAALAEKITRDREQIVAAQAARKDALNRAEALWRGGQHEQAVQALEVARTQYGDDPALAALAEKITRDREQIAAAQAARKEALSRAEALMRSGQIEQALQAIEAARARYGDDPALAALADSVAHEKAVRKEAAEAKALADRGQHGQAIARLETAVARYPEAAELTEALARTRIIGEVTALIETRKFDDALSALETTLREYPDEAGLLALRQQIAAAQAARKAAHSRAEALCRNGEFKEALEVIRSAQSRYGDDRALDALSGRISTEQAIHTAGATARSLVEGGRYEQAIVLLESAVARHPGAPKLARELERARLELTISEVRGLIEERKFDQALAAVEAALRVSPAESRLRALRQQIATAQSGRAAAVARAEALRQKGEFENALSTIKTAQAQYGEDPALSALAQAISRQSKVRTAAAQARALVERERYDQAIVALESILARYPGEPELEQELAHARLERTRNQEAEQRSEAIRAALAEARSLLNAGRHEQAIGVLESALSRDPDNADLAAELAQARRLLEQSPRAESAAHAVAPAPIQFGQAPRRIPEPEIVPSRRLPSKVLVAAAAVALLIAGTVSYRLLRGPGTSLIEIRTSPAGALVRVRDQTCTTPDCRLELKPGTYPVEATLPGYRVAKSTLTVSKGASGPLPLILEPLAPALRLMTNLPSGTVRIDGRSAGELQGGQFTRNLAPGKHELVLTAKDAGITVRFESGVAGLPVLVQLPQVRDGEAAVVTSFHGQAVVICPGCGGQASLDGQPAVAFNGELRLPSLTDGDHEVKIGDGSKWRTVAFSSGNQPSLSVSLNSGRNVGTLLVETGVAGASVLLNGRVRGRTNGRGEMALPLDAQNYAVRVEMPGYRSDPPQVQAQVNRGEQARVRFKLEELTATLRITAGTPGANIAIDGRPVGVVGPDGGFSTTVKPGEHQIEITKEGQRVTMPKQFSANQTLDLRGAEAQIAPPPKPKPAVVRADPPPPPPPPKPDPAVVEAQDWQQASASGKIADLESFRASHPGSKFDSQAAGKIEQLKWATTDKTSRAELRKFLNTYQTGAWADQARLELNKLDQQDAYQADAKSILETLSRYSAAYTAGDPEAVLKLMIVTSKSMERTIRESLKMKARLQLSPEAPEITGQTAKVRCKRSVSVAADGKRASQDDTPTFTLQKVNDRWFIVM